MVRSATLGLMQRVGSAGDGGENVGDGDKPQGLNRDVQWWPAAMAAIAAVGAAMASGAPTGLAVWDLVLRMAVAALFVLATARAPGWVAIIAATMAAIFSAGGGWMPAAGLALVLAMGAAGLPRFERILVPIAAAVTVQALVRIEPGGFFGLPSIVTGCVVVLAAWFAYRSLAPVGRRRSRRILLGLVVAVGVIGAVGGLTLLGARGDVENGINMARKGLDAARDASTEQVSADFESAAELLESAESKAASPLAMPLRLVPVAAQHRDAVVVATRHGSALARQVSHMLVEADVSTIKMEAGEIDLSILADMEPDLVDTVEVMDLAITELDEVQSPWLVPQLATRIGDLNDEMKSVYSEAKIAADAAGVVPAMLGHGGPRRYFVAFGSPAESRELGGFIGSWVLLEFDDGNVARVDGGRISSLYDLVQANQDLSQDEFPPWYVRRARPHIWPQNVTSSPDMSVVAQAARQIFDGLAGGPIDGFVYADGYALAAMLELLGPVSVDGVDGRINSNNAIDFLFDGQYRVVERDVLKSELDNIFDGLFERLVETRLPGPERLGKVLGPVARQGRLQVMTFNEAENEFLRSIHLQRRFGWPTRAADGFGIVQANGTASKMDLYLHRTIVYDVTVTSSGYLSGTVDVELVSQVPDDAPAYALGRDEPGLNRTYLSLYTPHQVAEIRVDGDPVQLLRGDESGYRRYEADVALQANTTAVVEFDIVGQVDPDRPYDVSVWHQPLVNDDQVTIRLRGASNGPLVHEFTITEPTLVDFVDPSES